MCGSQVMMGLILETTRWRQWYQKTKTAFLWSTIVRLMMKHSIPPFSRSRISKMQVILTYHLQKKSY